MIIQVRGTSGSGKSTVMRRVMNSLGGWNSVKKEGRKQPLYYVSCDFNIVVLGHYESPCGGCDTIGSAAAVYEIIKNLERDLCKVEFDENGNEVLTVPTIVCEGLLLSEDCKWTSQLDDVRVIFLTTPLEKCIEQIKGRREAAGNDKPLNVENTTNRVAVIERARLKLLNLGVTCVRCSSDQAVGVILKWLKLG